MVDFKKRLAAKTDTAITDPLQLYETLDRASNKGPLRPAQVAVLSEWHARGRDLRDVIVKLHTGQGKTLIGLLILQSRLNSGQGPALYLCPDNYLTEQTAIQAAEFGILTCSAPAELPDDFINSKRILVTSVQKLFNGLTRFGLSAKSMPVASILMDDAHACSDIIREQCRMRIPREDAAYAPLLELFSLQLESQGTGTYADIKNGKHDAFLPVPYWAWQQKESEIA